MKDKDVKVTNIANYKDRKNSKYLTVSALTKYIKRKLDTDRHLREVFLRGEISNFKHHSRGHMYMTIKDDQSRIQAVMFAGYNRHLKFRPENGMNVLIKGEVSVYEVQGQYQLYIHHMEPDGVGSLYLAFEQLKEKLRHEGIFDLVHKKKLPPYPEHIGVVTSPTGAAVRDIITTIKRRYPIVEITVIPVLVQGTRAAESIKKGIEYANELGIFDVLIVGRGGGSIEELWSFNEEIVAKAIFYSNIPVISAVGHETDVTISDYAADLRAPTPTGAAELAVPHYGELKDRITSLKRILTKDMQQQIKHFRDQLNRIYNSYAFRYPEQLIKQKEQELDQLTERMERMTSQQLKEKKTYFTNHYNRLLLLHPEHQLKQSKESLTQLMKRNNHAMERLIEHKANDLRAKMDKLSLLNPVEIMKRGFALPYSEDGQIIKSVNQVTEKDRITVNMHDGNLHCEVLAVEGGNENE